MIYQLENHIANQLKEFFNQFDFIDKVVVFGSRARHDCTPKSDIDLCIYSLEMTDIQFSKLKSEIDELPILYKLDVVHFEKVNKELQDNVVRDGKLLSRKLVSITEVSEFQGGSQPPKSKWSDIILDGYIRMLQIRDFTKGDKKYIQYVKDEKKLKKCNKNDILIARYGASVGKIVTGLDGAYNVALMKITPSKILNREFLFQYLKSNLFQNMLLSISDRAAQAGFNKEDLEKIIIPLPTLTKQKKIANALDKASELITLRKESIKKLDELSKSIFIDMFGDPVLNPKKWNTLSLKEIGKVQTGNTPPREKKEYYGNFIEWIKSDNILKDKQYISQAKEYLSEEGLQKARVVDKNSLLITCIAGSMSSIGNVAMTDRKVTFNQQINSISPYEDNILYLYYAIKLSKKYIEENSSKSMKIMINKSNLENLTFPIPPLELQNKFATIIEKIEEQKALYEKELKLLENNFDSLLDESFN